MLLYRLFFFLTFCFCMQRHYCYSEESIKVGPWGGPSGTDFSFKTTGGVAEIIISHGEVIDSISFKAIDANGKIEYSDKFGGDGGGQTTKIILDYPGEYLTEINGAHDKFQGHLVVKSLCFITNRAKYGPFGSNGGTPFYFPFQDGAIVGFHGRSGALIDAIGFHVKPQSSSSSCSCQELTTKVNNVITLMNGDVPREAGPWGGNKGKSWDDGVFAAIQQVHVHERNGVVSGIQIQYLTKDGELIWSKRHGGAGNINRIKLDCDCEAEYLVSMIGFSAPVVGNEGFEAVRSITFYSNKRKYGPFGVEIGTAFNSALSDGKIVGFHGRSGAFLDAIGVHMEYL